MARGPVAFRFGHTEGTREVDARNQVLERRGIADGEGVSKTIGARSDVHRGVQRRAPRVSRRRVGRPHLLEVAPGRRGWISGKRGEHCRRGIGHGANVALSR